MCSWKSRSQLFSFSFSLSRALPQAISLWKRKKKWSSVLKELIAWPLSSFFFLSSITCTKSLNKFFPNKCNVTIAQVKNKDLIKVKVWERGAGLTKACGTAACATAFAAKLNNLCNDKTDIEFENGKLTISIDEKNSIHMKGPVSDIKEIEINL